MEIVVVSDLHGKFLEMEHPIPEGDIFIAAGDVTQLGSIEEFVSFNDWLASLPHEHKFLVPGAHDTWLQELPEAAEKVLTNCTYLVDKEVIVQGVRFYGTPVQHEFYEFAYTHTREAELLPKIQAIPSGTNVLITHVPPKGVRDFEDGAHVGSQPLIERVLLVKPEIHVFGHVHEQYGIEKSEGIMFVNAAICDVAHRPCNKPLKFSL